MWDEFRHKMREDFKNNQKQFQDILNQLRRKKTLRLINI